MECPLCAYPSAKRTRLPNARGSKQFRQRVAAAAAAAGSAAGVAGVLFIPVRLACYHPCRGAGLCGSMQRQPGNNSSRYAMPAEEILCFVHLTNVPAKAKGVVPFGATAKVHSKCMHRHSPPTLHFALLPLECVEGARGDRWRRQNRPRSWRKTKKGKKCANSAPLYGWIRSLVCS